MKISFAITAAALLLLGAGCTQAPAPADDLGNADEKADLIFVTSPAENAAIVSPIIITGEARGTWYFEATFPVFVWDEDGDQIGQGYAQAEDEWMTEDFVPFSATVHFTVPEGTTEGYLVLAKDNPSGLPEYDDELIVPVQFE